MPKAPEQQARVRIDAQLEACGWAVQDFKNADFSAGRGIALREVRLKTGPCDYLLLVDRRPVGVVEAKKEGTTLSIIADQSTSYANNLPDYLAAEMATPPPFRYESTGIETFFRDDRDPFPRSRPVFTFHRPETLGEWASEPDTLRGRLDRMPEMNPLVTIGMRDCQIEAIRGLQESFSQAHPRALIHMATGAAKAFTACAFVYPLIKPAGPKRADDISAAELAQALGRTPSRDVVYNPAVPIEKFDFIVTDECHRSIYNLWRQGLEYFDAFLVGLTATPAPQTIAYFHQNRVAEYNHERAVAGGVNVGYDGYRIRTRTSAQGGKVAKGLFIDRS